VQRAHEASSRWTAGKVGHGGTHGYRTQHEIQQHLQTGQGKRYMNRRVKEAIEIQVHPNSFNRD
ncbi:hypothetical protein Cfor_09666, partial [Coptotermes formosanus]